MASREWPPFRRMKMKYLRHLVSEVLVSAVLVSGVLVSGVMVSSSAAFGQGEAKAADQKMAGMDHSQKASAAPKSDAQVGFEAMKASLAGQWEGQVSTDLSPEMKKALGADGP